MLCVSTTFCKFLILLFNVCGLFFYKSFLVREVALETELYSGDCVCAVCAIVHVLSLMMPGKRGKISLQNKTVIQTR